MTGSEQSGGGMGWGWIGFLLSEETKNMGVIRKRKMKRTGICKIKLVECFYDVIRFTIFPIFRCTQYHLIFAFDFVLLKKNNNVCS